FCGHCCRRRPLARPGKPGELSNAATRFLEDNSMKYPRTPLKTLIIAAAAILLGAPVALAASASSGSHHAGMSSSPMGGGGGELADASLMSQCTTLSKQFDQAQAAHKTD